MIPLWKSTIFFFYDSFKPLQEALSLHVKFWEIYFSSCVSVQLILAHSYCINIFCILIYFFQHYDFSSKTRKMVFVYISLSMYDRIKHME